MVKRKPVQDASSDGSVVEKKRRNHNGESVNADKLVADPPLPCDTGDIAAAFELLGQSMNLLADHLRKSGCTKVVQKHVWQPLVEKEDPAPLLLDSFMSGVIYTLLNMVSSITQLRWLLWKNWIVIKRRYIATPLEFLIPALIPVILLLIRQKVISGEVDTPQEWAECHNLCSFPTGVNFSSIKGLVYYPTTPFTKALMEMAVRSPQLKFSIAKGDFSSEDDMVEYIQYSNGTVSNMQTYAAGIVFTRLDGVDKSTGWPTKIQYKIRLPATPRNRLKQNNEMNPFSADSNWRTQNVFPNPMPVGPREKSQNCSANPNYQEEGFTAIQCAIGVSIVELFNGSSLNVSIVGQRHPFPTYYQDVYVLVIQQNFANMLLLAFFCLILNAASDVTSEREDKLKETLKMMGVSSSVQWASWIIRYAVSSIIICFLQVLFYSIPTPDHPPVIPKSDPTLVFVFMLLSALASVSFAFMVSSFLSSASSAAVATAIVYLLSYAPYQFLQLRYGSVSLAVKLAMMLDSTVAMGFGGLLIGDWESLGLGATWPKVGSPASTDDDLTLVYVFLMLILDIVLYCSIAFYVETVRPGEFGVPQPWYFPIMPSFWFPKLNRASSGDDGDIGGFSSVAPVPLYANHLWFERKNNQAAATDPEPVVQIRQLTRRFGKQKTAVDELSLDLYEGHVTSLLGHNGSGKTTTMFMLTGFLAPTSGTARVAGYDIRQASDLAKVRQTMGLCPQHDVLFRQLTVTEHLELFALLKGCSGEKLHDEVERALVSVNLKEKKTQYARNMSGGQKRRLSVAIALIGGSKVVILDEPTSGLDPDARRSLWDVIERARAGRAILLTTHFLEEADALSDRIAVLSTGRLRCVGSPMFLKRTLGGGYRLTIEVLPTGDLKRIGSLVTSLVPSAVLWSQTLRNELIYTLPLADSAAFPRLMDELENAGRECGVASLGLTASSIEDVFVVAGIAQEFDENKTSSKPQAADAVTTTANFATEDNNLEVSTNNNDQAPQIMMGVASSDGTQHQQSLTSIPEEGFYSRPLLWFVQFEALCFKHFVCIWRSPLIVLAQLLVPLLFAGIAVFIIKTIPGLSDAPPLLLTPDHYDVPIVSTFSNSSSTANAAVHNNDGSSAMLEAYKKAVTQYPVQYSFVDSHDYIDLVAYLEAKGAKNLPDYRMLYNFGASFAENKVAAYFNGDGYHAVAVSLGAVISGLFGVLPNNGTLDDDRFIQTINHPLPPTPIERVQNDELEYTNGFIISFQVMFGLAVYMGCCVIQPVSERMSNSKQLQFIAGASPIVYWLAMFASQLLMLIPSIGLIVALFAATGFTAFSGDDRPAHFFVMMGLFFASAAPQNYLLSLLFGTPNRALVWLILWNLMTAEVTILAVGILSLPGLGLQDVGDVCETVFLYFLPQFGAGQALEDYYSNWVEVSICEDPQVEQWCEIFERFNITSYPFPCCPAPYCGTQCWSPTTNYLSLEKNGVGKYLIAMAAQAVVYFTLLLLIDYRFFQRLATVLKRFCSSCSRAIPSSQSTASLIDNEVLMSTSYTYPNDNEDIDVAAERRKVDLTILEGQRDNNLAGLQVQNVIQRYSSSVLAVAGVSFSVKPGSCFGLLGFNGAGKTSLYRIITADMMPTDGDVFVAGCSVRTSSTVAQSNLGYCPQAVGGVDGLQEELTGRQQLRLMAKLRGIRGDVGAYVNRLLDFLYLSRFADRPSRNYSGGMRRKLSTAVSLIGKPPVVLLDEPTTGMDPAARRQFWRIVDQLRRDGSTIVLTSHSMDECDLLCDKIAVMVKGRLACIGSPSHLKARFGGGQLILIAKAPSSAGLQAMLRYVETNITGAVLKDAHLGTASFTIKYVGADSSSSRPAGAASSPSPKKAANTQTWSHMFQILERGRAELGLIEDYSLSHTTLERVFLTFAGGAEVEAVNNNNNNNSNVTTDVPSVEVISSNNRNNNNNNNAFSSVVVDDADDTSRNNTDTVVSVPL